MTLDEMKEQAKAQVEVANPDLTNLRLSKVYENLMDGTLFTFSFRDSSGKEEYNHVHFYKDQSRFYRYHSEVLNAISNYKERSFFFRFLEHAGIGGLIAVILIIVFSSFLGVLAFSKPDIASSVVEVIKLSFTTILGFFFGSQAASRR